MFYKKLPRRSCIKIVWFFSLTSIIVAQIRRGRYPDAKFDLVNQHQRLIANVLIKTTVQNAVSCVKDCVLHGQCKSINVNLETKECELLDATTSEDNQLVLEHSPGWTHYDYYADEICSKAGSNEFCCPEGWLGKHCESRKLSLPSPTLNVPYVNKHIPETREFTLSGWINPITNSSEGFICAFYPSENYVALIVKSSSWLTLLFKGSAFNNLNEDPLPNGKWTHVAISWHIDENSIAHIITFIDGRLIGDTTSSSANLISSFVPNDYFVNVGNDNDGGVINVLSQTFLGEMLDWNFYTKRLSQDDVIALYNGEQINKDNLAVAWNDFIFP